MAKISLQYFQMTTFVLRQKNFMVKSFERFLPKMLYVAAKPNLRVRDEVATGSAGTVPGDVIRQVIRIY